MRKKIVLSLVSIILAWPAYGEEKILCPSPEAFIEEVYNCGQNNIVTIYAKNCANALMKKSKKEGKALALLLAELEKLGKNKQDQSYLETKNRLDLTAKVLLSQIEELKKNTDIIANYTDAMIDFPDAMDDESSAECFNTAFHSLQKIVDELDKEILNSQAAYGQAQVLLGSKQLNTDMGTVAEGDSWTKGNRAPAAKGASVKVRRNASTISGEIKPSKLPSK